MNISLDRGGWKNTRLSRGELQKTISLGGGVGERISLLAVGKRCRRISHMAAGRLCGQA